MPEKSLEYAWRTDRGRVRTLNEDAISVHPDQRLVVIADGIGGANAGEIASRLAVRVVREAFQSLGTRPETKEAAADFIQRAVLEANRIIYHSASQTPRYAGMGTTVVVGYFGPDWLVFCHVGDSRLYLFRAHMLHQLTRDHSLIQEVVDQGFFSTIEDAQRYGIRQNILTRGLGSLNQEPPDIGEIELSEGDLFLFCTDGLSGMVPDPELKAAMEATRGDPLDRLEEQLLERAYEGGGLDNITFALVRVSEPSESTESA